MKLTVHVLGIHLLGQKIVLISGLGDALEKINIPSPLERYFGRPIDSSYDQLAYWWFWNDLPDNRPNDDVHSGGIPHHQPPSAP
jgi:hypothetical protein